MRVPAYLVVTLSLAISCKPLANSTSNKEVVVVWQPSHQTDTGTNFSEAEVSNGIAEAAMSASPKLNDFKVWSLHQPNVHHADRGSNTVIEHTSAMINGQPSGYAWELQQSNARKPTVFISLHNNGGTNRHAIWGYIHYGDHYEAENRELAARLIKAVSDATNLENRGVLLDSTTGRNDYRCATTGARAFYSLDENINTAPYRVLLEIGDNKASYDFLRNAENQKIMGRAIRKALADWMEEKKLL